ncbi:hypothetical protein ACLKA6_019341 [Drosophila palustris]
MFLRQPLVGALQDELPFRRPLCTVAAAGYKQHRLDSPSAPHSDKMQIRDYFVVLLRKLPANGAVGAAGAAEQQKRELPPPLVLVVLLVVQLLMHGRQRIRMQFVLPQLILFMSLGYKYICEIAYLCRCLVASLHRCFAGLLLWSFSPLAGSLWLVQLAGGIACCRNDDDDKDSGNGNRVGL